MNAIKDAYLKAEFSVVDFKTDEACDMLMSQRRSRWLTHATQGPCGHAPRRTGDRSDRAGGGCRRGRASHCDDRRQDAFEAVSRSWVRGCHASAEFAHDAAEGDIMGLSLSERCKSQVDGELERIGIKVAAHFAEKPRHAPGKTAP